MLEIKKIDQNKQGEIYSLEGDSLPFQDLTILITKQGFARGGSVHNLHDENTVIISGDVTYFKKGRAPEHLTAGEKKFSGTIIPKEVPHYFISLSDSIVLEWGVSPEEKAGEYKPYREIVNKINKEV